MRLINADKLKTEMLLNKTSQEISDVDERQNDVVDWCIKDVDDAPTVEAIPIEWIKKWNQKNENFLLYMGLARKLIEDWGKENEK